MKYAIVLDSSSSLPEAVLLHRPIKVLPIKIHIDDEVFPDQTDEQKLLEVYRSGRINKHARIRTTPPIVQEVRDFVLKEIVPEYDFAICQTLAKSVSPVYDHIASVAMQITRDSRQVRKRLQINAPFRMTCISCGTTVAGQGLIAFYADVMLARGMEYKTYKREIEQFKTYTKGYVAVRDLMYARQRGMQRGHKTIPLAKALTGELIGLSPIVLNSNEKMAVVAMPLRFKQSVARLFQYAIDRIEEGLHFPVINISIAAPTSKLPKFQGFEELQDAAHKANVTLLVGVMSLAASIHYGAGAVALGIAPVNSTAEP